MTKPLRLSALAQPTLSLTARGQKLIWLTLCVLACGLIGCGTETYEKRLSESVAYFQYREKLDLSLELRPWSNFGIDFRPPKGFVEVAPPPEGEPDQRQPEFLSPTMPGLIAAFKGEVKVDIPNSEVRSLPAWVLLCSNHQSWLERETNPKIQPSVYLADLADSLADGFHADDGRPFKRHSNIDPWKFTDERVPRGTPYVPIKNYDYIPLGDTFKGVETDVFFFRYVVKDIQLGVIAIAPKQVDRRERFFEKLSLGMEQLTMSDAIPRSQKKSAKPVSGGGI